MWRWQGATGSLLVGGERIYAAGGGRITAIDLADGTLAWSSEIGSEDEDCACGLGAIVVVGDRLFVPVGEAVAVLDADDGALIARTPIGAAVGSITGPPVVVRADSEAGTSLLVRLDDRDGSEITRLELPSLLSLDRFGDRWTAYVVEYLPVPGADDAAGAAEEIAEGPGSDDEAEQPTSRSSLVGLDADLVVSWRLALGSWASAALEGDQLVVTDYQLDGSFERREVDVVSGLLGAPLPDPEVDEQLVGWPLACALPGVAASTGTLELDVAMADDGAAMETVDTVIRQPGAGRWQVALPGRPEECLPAGEQLLLRLERESTRNLLAVVHAKRARREQLLLLPGGIARAVAMVETAAGSRLVFEMAEGGLFAIDPFAAGEPEAETRSLAEAVAEVLAHAGEFPAAAVAKGLADLGPEALPIAVGELPNLEGNAFLGVALFADQAHYRPAAEPLAAVLDRLADEVAAAVDAAADDDGGEPYAGEARWIRDLGVQALAHLAGPDQVPTLVRFANRESPFACQAALAALGRIATPPALAAVDRLLAPPPSDATPWFVPPPRPELSPLSQRAAQRLAFEAGDQGPDWEAIATARRSRDVTIDGKVHRIFPDSRYGGWADFWIVGPGAKAKSTFLGEIGWCDEIGVEVGQQNLVVSCADEMVGEPEQLTPPSPPLRLSLGSWRQDRDGDSLTDRFEERLGLDPERADSDGDGVADAIDRTPNAVDRRPSAQASGAPASPTMTADDELLLAAFAHFVACADETSRAQLLYVVAPSRLDWRGRPGPTVTVDERILTDGGYDGTLPLIALAARDDAGPAWSGAPEPPPLAPGEHRVWVRQPTADGEAPGAEVGMTLRRIGERWVISGLESWWPWPAVGY